MEDFVKKTEEEEPTSQPPKADEEKPKTDEGGLFLCSVCKFSERYHGHGTSVPFARGIVFNEDAYVMRDPFTPFAHNAYLFLGGPCSLCQQLVCVNCSVFYVKRFCVTCYSTNQKTDLFPVEVQKKFSEIVSKNKTLKS